MPAVCTLEPNRIHFNRIHVSWNPVWSLTSICLHVGRTNCQDTVKLTRPQRFYLALLACDRPGECLPSLHPLTPTGSQLLSSHQLHWWECQKTHLHFVWFTLTKLGVVLTRFFFYLCNWTAPKKKNKSCLFKVNQTCKSSLAHSWMEECLSAFVIQFLTSQLMLNSVQGRVQTWLTEWDRARTPPLTHAGVAAAGVDPPRWPFSGKAARRLNRCHTRPSRWQGFVRSNLKCKAFGLLAIALVFLYAQLCCLLEYSATNMGKLFSEETSGCGKVLSVGWLWGIVKVTLCFALKKGLQQINQCETHFGGEGVWPSPLAHVTVQLFHVYWKNLRFNSLVG